MSKLQKTEIGGAYRFEPTVNKDISLRSDEHLYRLAGKTRQANNNGGENISFRSSFGLALEGGEKGNSFLSMGAL